MPTKLTFNAEQIPYFQIFTGKLFYGLYIVENNFLFFSFKLLILCVKENSRALSIKSNGKK